MKKQLVIALMFLLAACTPNIQNIGKQSDTTRFYTLTANATGLPEKQAALPQVTVGVGPVTVADYLDRSHIVIRKTGNQLELAEFDRWASTPEKEIQRVLAADLALLLGTERVMVSPWNSDVLPDITVEVSIEQFELDQNGQARLVAAWQLYTDDGKTPLTFRRINLSQATSSDYNAISSALSDLTGQMSAEIALAIRRAVPVAAAK